MSTSYIGIKLGSTTTYIYKPGNGIVLKEASLIAVSTNDSCDTPKTSALPRDA